MINSQLSQISPIHMPSEALYNLVLANPNASHIKDAKTGRYILSNKKLLELYGMSSIKQLLGLTIFDIDKFMDHQWNKKYSKEISKIDHMVVRQNKVFTKELDLMLNFCGQVYVHDLIKLPLLNKNNEIKSILTISNDRTDKIDKFTLLDIYINMHKGKSAAVKYFMNYLGISKFFSKGLTLQELNCLLHMQTNSSYKYLAKKLNISIKTVETHLSHINDKLIESGQLQIVTAHIRKSG